MTELVPPQNLQAEENILGAMLMNPAACDVATEHLTPEDFYRETHGRIFKAATRLHSQGEPVDTVTVINALETAGDLETVGGKTRLYELGALVPASANVRHYVGIVKQHAVERGLIRAGQEIAKLGWDRTEDGLDKAEQIVYSLDRHVTRDEEPVPDVLVRLIQNISYLREHPREVVGVPTGYPDMDRLTQGFQPGNLIILAARPGMGKSALALCIAGNLASRRKVPVGLWTLEMSKAELLQRMLSMASQIDVPKIRAPWLLSDEEEGRLVKAAGDIAPVPLEIFEPGELRPLELRAQARRFLARHPDTGLLIVDYLQLMSGGKYSENRTQEVSHISRMLKVLAREMNVPVLALSQLSRGLEQRQDKRPVLSDLRESGSIEQDADVVAFIYRDEIYNPSSPDIGTAEVIIAKNRNGETGLARLAFIRGQTRFSSLKPRLVGDMGMEAA